jgi:tight adherence protein C
MNGDDILMIAAFGVASSVVFLLAALVGRRRGNVETRLAELSRADERGESGRLVLSWLHRLGQVLMPDNDANRDRVQTRLMQAGFYRGHSFGVFLGMKFLLMVSPMVVGLAMSAVGMMPLSRALFLSAMVGLAGTLAPGIWLRSRRASRQIKIRRALPDALDVIVICLEGGLSLPAAIARVSDELHAAYPLLATEMLIVRKEIELGRAMGEAFQDLADRFDADELRSMAAMISQAERYGASLVRTLRVQADGLRLKRHQAAETKAQKAPLKLVFPTVLCIFPALYLVLIGPAVVKIMQMFGNMR